MSPFPLSQRRFLLLASALMVLIALAWMPSFRQPARAAETKSGVLTSRPRSLDKPAEALAVGQETLTSAGQRSRVAVGEGAVLYVNEKTSLQHSGEHRRHGAVGPGQARPGDAAAGVTRFAMERRLRCPCIGFAHPCCNDCAPVQRLRFPARKPLL